MAEAEEKETSKSEGPSATRKICKVPQIQKRKDKKPEKSPRGKNKGAESASIPEKKNNDGGQCFFSLGL